ncbi:MAG: hypothetical protein V3W18_00830 [candidate division Zixibacteria bacterium]
MTLKTIAILLLIFPMAIAQTGEKPDPWQPVKYFEGSWTGTSTGKAGEGQGERVYEFIMNGAYLYCRNSMTFAPQEKNPKGETHEDWGFFSHDNARNMLVMRQFNIERFINRYTLDSLSNDGKTIHMNSEESENAPRGLRARYKFEIKSDDEFIETFELGFPDKEFSCWMTNTWRRKR